MKKFLVKILLRLTVGDIDKAEISQQDREDAYDALYGNQKLMKVLNANLNADKDTMMKKDSFKSDYIRGLRHGAFIRTEAYILKAKEMHAKASKIKE